jgi:glycosyltransferase involved in cell wall biosynthesis
MPENVLFIFDGKMNNYGLGLVTAQQVRALAENGYNVDLLARSDFDCPGVNTMVQRYTWANFLSWISRPFYYDAQRRAFAALAVSQLKRKNYAAVIGWIGGMLPLVGETGRRNLPLYLNVPRIFETGRPEGSHPESEHFPPWRWPRVSQSEKRREYAEPHTRLLLPSDYSRRLLRGAGLPDQRLLVIERGYAAENFYPPAKPEATFRLLFSGKVTPRKGVEAALEAWREADLDNAEFWFAGRINPEYEKQWRNSAPDNVKFLGFSSNLGDLMRQCHAQILLSSDEGQAKSLIEGAACGLPTIATSVSGFPFERGDLGFEVSAEDISAIASILRRLKNEPELQQRMSSESARVMKEHYTWDSFRRRFVDKIEAALEIAP